MTPDEGFLLPRGNYAALRSYRKAEVVYDLTHHFCARFLRKGDRTIDQMVQAARSGKQNIALCLIHQANYLLDRQIRQLERDFLKHGGIRERMTRARRRQRK